MGHALAALTTAAAALGWNARLLDTPTAAELAALFHLPGPLAHLPVDPDHPADSAAPHDKTQTGRQAQGAHPEPEHPDCLLVLWSAGDHDHGTTATTATATGVPVSSGGGGGGDHGPDMAAGWDVPTSAILEVASAVPWQGVPNQVSPYHYGEWPAAEMAAAACGRATRSVAGADAAAAAAGAGASVGGGAAVVKAMVRGLPSSGRRVGEVVRGRRSAQAFDPSSMMGVEGLLRMLWAMTPRGEEGALAACTARCVCCVHAACCACRVRLWCS